MENTLRKLQGLSKLPWRLIGAVAAVSFIVATVVSLGIAKLLMPKFSAGPSDTTVALNSSETFGRGGQATLTQSDLDKVLLRNLFNRDGALGDATAGPAETTAGTSAEVPTDLPIKVLGIIYGGTPFTGLVTIENKEKRLVNSFIVGDAVIGDSKLIEIHPDKIFISRNGRREYAILEDFRLVRSRRGKKAAPAGSTGIAPIAQGPPPEKYSEDGFSRDGARIQMTEQYKNRVLGEDFSKTLEDAKASPNMVDGELRGFVLTRIRENSIYQKAGFQNGDVVEEINGEPLRDAAGAIKLLQSLRNEPNISVRLRRGDRLMNLDLSVN